MKPSAVEIPLAWGKLAGLHWARPGAPKVLCLHGWLDNAASYAPLAPYLRDFDLLALDSAGHGLSAHRPPASRYHFSEYLYDLDAALAVLAWDNCHLIGHSMGGSMAASFAAAIPERVNKLVLLDSIGVITLAPEQAVKQLRLSIKSVRKNSSNLRPYASVEAAMQSRQKKSSLSDKAVRRLCERALEHTGEHYRWRTDPRLNWRSPQLLSDAQALEMLRAIQSPTLAITTPALSDFLGEEHFNKRLAAIANCKHVINTGHHHFHMENPHDLGSRITDFLQQQD